MIKSALLNWLGRYPHRIAPIRRLAKRLSPGDTILLDYAVTPKPRWPLSSPHPQLKDILNANRAKYRALLSQFLDMHPKFIEIKRRKSEVNTRSPYWINGWMPALDGVAIYGHISLHKPAAPRWTPQIRPVVDTSRPAS